VLAIARRPASLAFPKVEWARADISRDDVEPLLVGADVLVHLAWQIQPSHDEATMARTNVAGSLALFDAAARAGVGAIVYASSVGTYGDGPKDRRVDETWPHDGIGTSFYSRHKATVERALDRFEASHPAIRVVRMRPSLIFKRGQGSEARRLFLGPLMPVRLLRPRLLPVLPDVAGLRFQVVHTDDVADAYRRAIVSEARGPFNIAADPVLDLPTIAAAIEARTVPVPRALASGVVDLTWRAHLQPTPVGWLEMGLRTPLLSTDRARRELGWSPTRTAVEAVVEVLEGLSSRSGEPTARLEPRVGGHVGERVTGVGSGRRAPS